MTSNVGKAARLTESGSIRLILAVAIVLPLTGLLGLMLSGQAAADQSFRIAFDQSQYRIGPVEDLPVQVITEGAVIEGTVDDQGRVRIPKASFNLPVLGIDQPVKIRAYMGIEQDATGTWDPATGELEVDAKAGIWLSIDIPGTLTALQGAGVNLGNLGAFASILGSLGDLTCGFSPMDVTFTTESGSGQRFTKGLKGPGALVADWSKLGKFAGKTRLFGFLDVCSTIRSLAPGLISGLAGNAIPGLNLGNLDIAGLLNNLDNVDLGPSALTISRTIDESLPADLEMTTTRNTFRIRPGKVSRVEVTVANTGEAPATGVTVCAQLPKSSRASARCADLGTVAAGASASGTLAIKVSRSARPKPHRFSMVVSGSGLAPKSQLLTLRVLR